MSRSHLFSTPLFIFDREEFVPTCKEITELLVREASSTQGLEVANRGGTWHSPPNLTQREELPWVQATEEILAAVGAAHQATAQTFAPEDEAPPGSFGIQMWAMVMPTGGYVTSHHHARHDWSAILYTDAGDADPNATGGQVVFQDPKNVPTSVEGQVLFPDTFQVPAVTGRLVVFPAWLRHHVHPYTGTRPRVCLSANVRVLRATG